MLRGPALALLALSQLAACSPAPHVRVTNESLERAASAEAIAPADREPPSWLAQFVVLRELAAAVYEALSAPEAMSYGEGSAWIARVAAALDGVPSHARTDADAEAQALTGLLIEELAVTHPESRYGCQTRLRPWPTDVLSATRLLATSACHDFDDVLRMLYQGCRVHSTADVGEFCRGRWERWERTHAPACAQLPSARVAANDDGSGQPKTLRFAVVGSVLHADELDALGETLATAVGERTGRTVTYVSDTAWDYAPTCDGAYVPEQAEDEWSASIVDQETVGFIYVGLRSGSGPEFTIEVAAPHRPSAWLRAARALRPPGEYGMGGLGLTVADGPRGVRVLQSHGRTRAAGATWRAMEDLALRCLRWGHVEAVVSVSATGELVRATLRKPRRATFDLEGARCLARGLHALTKRARVAGRAHVSLEAGPSAEPRRYGFPAHDAPRVEACVGDAVVDLCLALNPDGSVRHWSGALGRELPLRALGSEESTPLPFAMQQCVERALTRRFACTERGDELVLRLPLGP